MYVWGRDEKLNYFAWLKQTTKPKLGDLTSLPTWTYIPRPQAEGREKEGLVHTACACAVIIIIQILNNPLTHGYCRMFVL